ncbi:Troponin C, slow skeletal and cardiac muscle [Desmophyllum pertusum]|uniref:Troponin C, slow skeletal and cardiac muscle n=1 Tax=Desmophyllum pertusum TaxID=174260 RepID=A0A9X0A524_9CNID|nr:Troponin C, slow skeletal and cardiac muscle [Desmophyllum pertusum]
MQLTLALPYMAVLIILASLVIRQRINEAIKKKNEQDIPMFSNEQIEEFEDAFSVYDVNGKGNIKVGDVFPLIRSLGYNPLEVKVWVFMNELDLTANRKLKFAEFLRLMAALIMDEDEREQQALDSIRVFDSEERGYISSEELRTALKCMPGSAQMRDFELREILRKADPDMDGKINIQDFQSLLPSVRLK